MSKLDLKKYAIYMTKHGSHAYGLSTPESDLDIKGVFIAPREYYYGFVNSVEQVEEKVPHDMVAYEIRKFFRLAADCNPNIIEVLHTDEADILESTELGRRLRSISHLFISQKAKFTFAGYAHSQLQRIRAHYRWLKNPPNAPPARSDYGLPENTLISSTDLGIAEATVRKILDTWDIDWEPFDEATKISLKEKITTYLAETSLYAGYKDVDSMLYRAGARKAGFSEDLIGKLEAEKKYSAARHEWDQYQNWVKTRNPKRAELEAKFGYDTKHAMHLVRLMRMGKEILETGKVLVRRHDREELLAIRHHGIWTYDQLVSYAEEKEKEIDGIYAAGTSPLPRGADRNRLDQYCIEMVETANERKQCDT